MKPIRSTDWDAVYGPHPEEPAKRASRRMEHGAASPVAVLRDARFAGSSGRGRYDSDFEFAPLARRHWLGTGPTLDRCRASSRACAAAARRADILSARD